MPEVTDFNSYVGVALHGFQRYGAAVLHASGDNVAEVRINSSGKKKSQIKQSTYGLR